MFFYDAAHQAQFEALVTLGQKGGQQNERTASLYVVSLLPERLLANFKTQDYVMLDELLDFTKEGSQKRLSKGEAQLIRLAYVLFHGDEGIQVNFSDYLGFGYEYKEVIIQALQLHYGLTAV